MLAYQREQGLSNFQWMILSQIGEYQPLPLARLIDIMGRDKSQVGRTVAFFGSEWADRAPAWRASATSW